MFVKFDFQNYFLGNFIVNLCFQFNGSYYAGWGNCRKLNCFILSKDNSWSDIQCFEALYGDESKAL